MERNSTVNNEALAGKTEEQKEEHFEESRAKGKYNKQSEQRREEQSTAEHSC